MLLISAKETFQIQENKSNSEPLTNSIQSSSIELTDGESHTIKYDFLYGIYGYGSSKIIGFTSRDFSEKPFIIRSYEKHPSEFELLTNYTVYNFVNKLFTPFYTQLEGEFNYLSSNYKSIHLNSITSPFSSADIAKDEYDLLFKVFGGRLGNTEYKGQQSWPLTFFHSLMKEKVAREAIFNYIISSYKKVEGNIPRTSKEDILSILNKLVTFLDLDIAKIKKLDPNNEWSDFIIPPGMNLDVFQEFLARRMLNDKIPLAELKLYFKEFKTIVEASIPSSKVTNIATLQVNNDLIIADANHRELKVSSLHSSNQFKIKTGDDIYVKCLIDNNDFYYQFERKQYGSTEFLGLYNSRLEVIRAPVKK
jgi:hypothetical protein